MGSEHEFWKEVTLFDGSTDVRVAPVPPVASDIIVDTESLVGRYLGKKCQEKYNKRKRGKARREVFFSHCLIRRITSCNTILM